MPDEKPKGTDDPTAATQPLEEGAEAPVDPVPGGETNPEIEKLREELAETRSNIGRLAAENGRRNQEWDEREARLQSELTEARQWQNDVSVESQMEGMTEEEKTRFLLGQTTRQVQELKDDISRRDTEAAEKERRGQEITAEYTTAVKAGVPRDRIDYSSVEAIQRSVVAWEREQKQAENQELRSRLTDLEGTVKETRQQAADAARSSAGDTAVPSSSGAVSQQSDEEVAAVVESMPEEMQRLWAAFQEEMAKPLTRRNPGRIMQLQRAAMQQGYELK